MEDEARPSKKPRGSAGSGLTAFALRTAKLLADDAASAADGGGKNNNLVFSPLSIYAVLALVAAGARGATRDELLALLGAPSRDELAEFAGNVVERALADLSKSGGPLVSYACGVWHDKEAELKPSRKVAVETYKADFVNKPEEAVVEVNGWVSETTKDLITSILHDGSVHSLTGLVLANAIYFKGKWSLPSPRKGPCPGCSNESKVDLQDMLEDKHKDAVPLVLKQVYHKAVIVVDEEGTEAAASSAGYFRVLTCARRSVDFVADHPFAFFVVEETSRSVVFMGHVLEPTASD